ncbi:BON domain-containing protein [Salmonella enterica]|nr:BON domain-containing protein [Salmonella enterica]EHE6020409.1 BON domain-containing protein [Salmonella enterica]
MTRFPGILCLLLLTGEVPDDGVQQAATKAVLSVSDVSHIWNETRTGTAISTGQKISDTWLASDIRAKLLLSSDTRLTDIKVITENSEAFLMELVTPEEGRRVADRVSRVSDVRHVTTAWTLKQ